MFIGNPETNTTAQAAVASGDKANGAALATTLLKIVAEQGKKLHTVLSGIVALSQEGRKAFRAELEAKRKATREEARWWSETEMVEPMKMAGASYFVRISEAITFSKAIDAGYVPNMDDSYHDCVSFARAFMAAGCAPGAAGQANEGTAAAPTASGKKVGRPAKAKLQKAIEYLEKLDLSDAERSELVKALTPTAQ